MRRILISVAVLLLAVSAGCGSGSSSSAGSAGAPVNGGTLAGAIPDNPDHLDTGISFAVEGWELLEATNNGLLTFKKAGGGQQSVIEPDIATAMPVVTDNGRTYTFQVRKNVMFSPPVNRAVRPSDFQYAIERLFHVGSPGVGFYTNIAGANAYAAHQAAHISGIVADDKTGTIAFHLVKPDGAFLDDMAIPFAFAVPAGMPYKDISTDPQWRVATGPYMVKTYTPKQQIVLVRNPNFHQWTAASPNGHVNEVDITIGTTPEQAVNETIDGQLDWYMEAVPPDRFTALRAQYPKQTLPVPAQQRHLLLDEHRKPPFDKLAVRQAVNYAIDRNALGQDLRRPGHPFRDGAAAGVRVQPTRSPPLSARPGQGQAADPAGGRHRRKRADLDDERRPGAQGGAVPGVGAEPDRPQGDRREGRRRLGLLGHAADPERRSPDRVQPLRPGLSRGRGLHRHALNGEHIVNVGNNDVSNTDDPTLNAMIDRTKLMPLGAARNAQWAKIDSLVHAARRRLGAVPAPGAGRHSSQPRLHGLIFTGRYFELIPEMWLSKQ